MPQQREPRSQDELSGATTHLQYEIRAFVESAEWLQRHPDGERWVDTLESYLLHARALLEFLGARGRQPRATDIDPVDFGADWVWPSTPVTAKLEGVLSDIDKYLSHLSWARVPVGQPGGDDGISWRPIELLTWIAPILRDASRAIRRIHPELADRLDIPLGMYPPLDAERAISFSTTNPPLITTTRAGEWSGQES